MKYIIHILNDASIGNTIQILLKDKYCFPLMNHESQYSQRKPLFAIWNLANKHFRKLFQTGDIFSSESRPKQARCVS